MSRVQVIKSLSNSRSYSSLRGHSATLEDAPRSEDIDYFDNRSSLIFAFSYAVWPSSTFIMWNVPSLGNYGPRRDFLHVIPTIKRQQSRLLQQIYSADYADMKITSVPSASMHTDQIKYKWIFSSSEKETLGWDLDLLLLLSYKKKPSTETLAFNPYNSCNQKIIVDSPPLSVVFSWFEFPRKKNQRLLRRALFSLAL